MLFPANLLTSAENKCSGVVPNVVLTDDHAERRSSGQLPTFPEKLQITLYHTRQQRISLYANNHGLTVVLQVNRTWSVLSWLSSSICARQEPLKTSGTSFYWVDELPVTQPTVASSFLHPPSDSR